MKIKNVIKGLGIFIGTIVLLIVVGVLVVEYRIRKAERRAEQFCEMVKVNEDVMDFLNSSKDSSFDRIVFLSPKGEVVNGVSKQGDVNISGVGFLDGKVQIIFQTGTPAFSYCEVEVQQHKVIAKKAKNHRS